MEHRKHARFAVNMKAALIHDRAMPLGCRVRDVSSGGMLLQCERHDKTRSLQEGDSVQVRLSFKQGDNRKGMPLPMIVRRVEENGIGAEFLQPQTQLMQLLEPYRLDREETQTVAVAQGQRNVATINAGPPPGSDAGARAERRRSAIRRARAQLSETRETPVERGAGSKPPVENPAAVEQRGSGNVDRRLFYTGLLSLLAAVAIVLVDYGDRNHTDHRLVELETAVDRQIIALASVRAQFGPGDDGRSQDLDRLSTRVESLATSFAALEARLAPAAGPSTPALTAAPPADAAENVSVIPEHANNGAISRTTAGSTLTLEPPAADKPGPWVINLVSLYDQNAANRFADKARAEGINADAKAVAVQDRQVWRVQVSGFTSREKASAYADTNKQKLGLQRVWIYKNNQ